MIDIIDWSKVPVPHMTDGIQRYVEHGIAPGHFMKALLSNDLMEAVGRADEQNNANLAKWIIFLRWQLPHECYGSPDKVQAWIAKGGLNGHEHRVSR